MTTEIGTTEAAELLSLSIASVCRLCNDGTLKARKLNGGTSAWLIEKDSVEAFRDARNSELGTAEVAEKFGVSIDAVRAWCDSGSFPGAHRDGKGSHWHIPEASVQMWLDAIEQGGRDDVQETE